MTIPDFPDSDSSDSDTSDDLPAARVDGSAPLESDPIDWQEQQLIVEDPDPYEDQ